MRRVADREDVDEATARRDVQAVFTTLAMAVAPGELGDMMAQLPRDFDSLLDVVQRNANRAIAQNPLVARVAELTSIDPPLARRAVEAVLETLAMRISEGEVEDLIARLPPDLAPPLERGLAENRNATRMSLQDFLARVAKREDVDMEAAERHARAVFAALSELVPGKEIHDVESELPRDYAPLFAGIV